MPSTTRSVTFIIIALASIATIRAYVIPEPLRSVDYRRHDLNVRIIEETSTHTVQTSSAAGSASELNGRGSDFLSQLNILSNYIDLANVNSNNIQNYASRASSYKDDKSFPQQCASELSDYYSNLLGAQSALGNLGRDKGLANYNRNDELQTYTKDLVNLNKDTLKAVTILTYQIPLLGPLLGPIIGDIKCILDEVLDAVENFTDGLLNSLRPLLKGIIQDYSQSMCSGSFGDQGLCLNPDSHDNSGSSSDTHGHSGSSSNNHGHSGSSTDSLGLDGLDLGDLDGLGLDSLGLDSLGLGKLGHDEGR